MTRTQLINLLILEHGYTSYLEIGTQNPDNNFNKINSANKVSVDPDPGANAMYQCTSDFYFEELITLGKEEGGGEKFDLIFIDGLHHADQVEKDIINSMGILNPGGRIVLHDCNPLEEWMQLVPRQHKVWYGDVWKAFVGFRLYNPRVTTYCLDFDCGCGVIHYTSKKVLPKFTLYDFTWAEFNEGRKHLLGLI